MATVDMRKKPRKKYPVPPATFQTLKEVSDWAASLYRVLNETEEGYGGNVYFGSTIPASSDGRDNDIWIKK